MYDGGSSCAAGKIGIISWILHNVPLKSSILDIGAGKGTYADLLQGHEYVMDAVEIYEPVTEKLVTKYRTCYCMNVCHFEFLQNYDLVIMGDVLEHLSVEDAQHVIREALQHTKLLLVAVPFMYEQDSFVDNPYEKHLQPDLNFVTMHKRYPELNLVLYVENDTELKWSNGDPFLLRYAYYYAKGALHE